MNGTACYAGMKSFATCENGVCDPNTGSCICNAGYIGAADFVTMIRRNASGAEVVLDCPTSTAAIRCLYTLVMLIYLFGMGAIVHRTGEPVEPALII